MQDSQIHLFLRVYQELLQRKMVYNTLHHHLLVVIHKPQERMGIIMDYALINFHLFNIVSLYALLRHLLYVFMILRSQ